MMQEPQHVAELRS